MFVSPKISSDIAEAVRHNRRAWHVLSRPPKPHNTYKTDCTAAARTGGQMHRQRERYEAYETQTICPSLHQRSQKHPTQFSCRITDTIRRPPGSRAPPFPHAPSQRNGHLRHIFSHRDDAGRRRPQGGDEGCLGLGCGGGRAGGSLLLPLVLLRLAERLPLLGHEAHRLGRSLLHAHGQEGSLRDTRRSGSKLWQQLCQQIRTTCVSTIGMTDGRPV